MGAFMEQNRPDRVTPTLVSYPQQAAVSVDSPNTPYAATHRLHHQYYQREPPPVSSVLCSVFLYCYHFHSTKGVFFDIKPNIKLFFL